MTVKEEQTRKQYLSEFIALVGGTLAVLLMRGTFDRGQWLTPAGRVVSERELRSMLDRVERIGGKRAVRVTQEFLAGKLPLAAWRTRMTQLLTATHTIAAQIAAGKQATASIESELRYLRRFANDIKAKRAGTANRIKARAKSYLMAVGVTYATARQRIMPTLGYTEAMRIRTARESCSECISYAARWIPITDMPPKGTLQCGSRCRCYLKFR